MYPGASSPVAARLHADQPLLLAGLERAACQAGVDVTTDDAAAALSVRCGSAGQPHPTLDLMADDGRVIVTVTAPPSPEAWSAAGALLGHLVDDRGLPASATQRRNG